MQVTTLVKTKTVLKREEHFEQFINDIQQSAWEKTPEIKKHNGGMKINGQILNNIHYANTTVFIAHNLQILLHKDNKSSIAHGLNINIHKTKYFIINKTSVTTANQRIRSQD